MTLIKHRRCLLFTVYLRYRLRVEIIFRLHLKFNNVSREQVRGQGGFCSSSISLRQHLSGWEPQDGAHNAWEGRREVT